MNTTPAEIQAALDRVEALHLTFKSERLATFACNVLKQALKENPFWPDDIDHDYMAESDRNVIGTTYKLLCNKGVLCRGLEFRRSRSKATKGRTIFKYWLQNRNLAKATLARYGEVVL